VLDTTPIKLTHVVPPLMEEAKLRNPPLLAASSRAAPPTVARDP
jgi:hypothetical protein